MVRWVYVGVGGTRIARIPDRMNHPKDLGVYEKIILKCRGLIVI
jgi:hypothetical protein